MELTNLPQKSEQTTQNFEIQKSLILAVERTNTPMFDLTNMLNDINSEFRNTSLEDIQKAIRNGSLGKYGKTYRFSTQEVCIWIREYLKEKNKNRVAL